MPVVGVQHHRPVHQQVPVVIPGGHPAPVRRRRLIQPLHRSAFLLYAAARPDPCLLVAVRPIAVHGRPHIGAVLGPEHQAVALYHYIGKAPLFPAVNVSQPVPVGQSGRRLGPGLSLRRQEQPHQRGAFRKGIPLYSQQRHGAVLQQRRPVQAAGQILRGIGIQRQAALRQRLADLQLGHTVRGGLGRLDIADVLPAAVLLQPHRQQTVGRQVVGARPHHPVADLQQIPLLHSRFRKGDRRQTAPAAGIVVHRIRFGPVALQRRQAGPQRRLGDLKAGQQRF